MSMCLAMCATCVCHLVIFNKYIGVGAILDTVRPDGSISLEYFIMTNELLGLNL